MNRTLLLAILVAALFVPVSADRDAEIVTIPIEREEIHAEEIAEETIVDNCEPEPLKRPIRRALSSLLRLRNN